ncbi:DNA topoisomerase [Cyclospora cayetanensis]|uniref:DNA topoisomerase n=1 Tax=Cyclospora cayetanensis TaxID=88456 RepID=A0A1D3CYI1_9EIME|nr:DNA topoisomerase [Cyclospora cayetanensis]
MRPLWSLLELHCETPLSAVLQNLRRYSRRPTDWQVHACCIEMKLAVCLFAASTLSMRSCDAQLYKELKCPLDGYELLLSVNPGGKAFPFCPLCYNDPPFDTPGTPFIASDSAAFLLVSVVHLLALPPSLRRDTLPPIQRLS